MKILMVCLGNICRSPLAEGILREKATYAGLNWEIDSAGTNGYHRGEPPHLFSQNIAAKHNLDIRNLRSRSFVAGDFDRFDSIFAMASDVVDDMRTIAGRKFNPLKVDLIMNLVYPGRNLDVPDPWYGPESGYQQVFDMLDHACEYLVKQTKMEPH